MHYAPETYKMWSKGFTLLKFDNFTATQILREIKLWQIQTVKNVIFYNIRDFELWILENLGLEKLLKLTKIKIQNL